MSDSCDAGNCDCGGCIVPRRTVNPVSITNDSIVNDSNPRVPLGTVLELTYESTGLWNVQTETSSYLIDMDNKKAMRTPYTGAGIHPDHSENREVYVSNLSGDGEWFSFHTLKQCQVGELMFIYKGGNGMRRATIVRKITKVYSNE